MDGLLGGLCLGPLVGSSVALAPEKEDEDEAQGEEQPPAQGSAGSQRTPSARATSLTPPGPAPVVPQQPAGEDKVGRSAAAAPAAAVSQPP
eukprot:CAMPEP_0171131338 /NCGR_PEP_ID=MMETSP0766_2-20121228/122531_1 /TAXON_ID=439317 /ORGANISM="Gambierdiscus australes, Strain CAWD 149" /LENGTH=90 /DNA_ID=CAMNT_0011594631 /DNA_START=32 /DNA_END=300 /DNA_ORIENTATION=-